MYVFSNRNIIQTGFIYILNRCLDMCEIYTIKLSISTLQYMMAATGYQINEAKHQQNVRCVGLLRTHPFLSTSLFGPGLARRNLKGSLLLRGKFRKGSHLNKTPFESSHLFHLSWNLTSIP